VSRMIEKILKALRIWGRFTIAFSSLYVWAEYFLRLIPSETVKLGLYVISLIGVTQWLLKEFWED